MVTHYMQARSVNVKKTTVFKQLYLWSHIICKSMVLFFPLPSDQIGGGFLVCYFFLFFSSFICFFRCSDGMEREACVCDHGFERSDLYAEIIIIIMDEPGKVANRARGQLNRKNENFPVRVRA